MMNEERGAVVAACLAVLTREFHSAGMDRDTALALLRDAPDKIDAALTRGFRAMVVYRLDGAKARGLPPQFRCGTPVAGPSRQPGFADRHRGFR